MNYNYAINVVNQKKFEILEIDTNKIVAHCDDQKMANTICNLLNQNWADLHNVKLGY